MKKFLFLSVFIVLSILCYSQGDFREGFVIQKGDTIRGLIDYHSGSKEYKTVSFKKHKDLEPTIYYPKDISGFGFTGSLLYESRSVNNSTEDSFVFMKTVIRGKVSLYNLDGVLYAQKNDSLYKLEIIKKEIIKDGVPVIVQTKSYLGILTLLLSDSEETLQRISDIPLDESRIMGLIRDYNTSVNYPYQTFLSGEPKVRIIAGLSAGYVRSNLECWEEGDSYVELPYKGSSSFSAGVSFDLSLPRITEKFSFHTEIVYFKSQFNGYEAYEYEIQANRTVNVELFNRFEMTQISIPFGLKYTFMVNRLSPYVSIGALTTIYIEKSNRWDQYNNLLFGDYSVIHNFGTAVKEMKNQTGYWFGAGLIYPITKRFSCSADLRYDLVYELADPPIYCDINDLWVSFGIQFRTK